MRDLSDQLSEEEIWKMSEYCIQGIGIARKTIIYYILLLIIQDTVWFFMCMHTVNIKCMINRFAQKHNSYFKYFVCILACLRYVLYNANIN